MKVLGVYRKGSDLVGIFRLRVADLDRWFKALLEGLLEQEGHIYGISRYKPFKIKMRIYDPIQTFEPKGEVFGSAVKDGDALVYEQPDMKLATLAQLVRNKDMVLFECEGEKYGLSNYVTITIEIPKKSTYARDFEGVPDIEFESEEVV
jgi:hypothetical protein